MSANGAKTPLDFSRLMGVNGVKNHWTSVV
jgi:hypothetical protein